MGVQFRQNPKNLQMKGVIATMAPGKRPTAGRTLRRVSTIELVDPATTLQALAALYERVADRLLERIHDQPDDRRQAQILGRHLDWVASRAQLVDSFRQAGDCAMTYICASADSYARLVPLVRLATEEVGRPERLSVALYLIERIDEELRVV